MALEEDRVRILAVTTAEEVIEGHLVERGRRRKRGDMTADAVFGAVRAHHHGHGVPAHEAFDSPLDFAATGIRDFF